MTERKILLSKIKYLHLSLISCFFDSYFLFILRFVVVAVFFWLLTESIVVIHFINKSIYEWTIFHIPHPRYSFYMFILYHKIEFPSSDFGSQTTAIQFSEFWTLNTKAIELLFRWYSSDTKIQTISWKHLNVFRFVFCSFFSLSVYNIISHS